MIVNNMKKFITVDDFSGKYDKPKGQISVMKHSGSIPVQALSKIGTKWYIDENYFIRRLEFANKVWLECHDMYYFLNGDSENNELAKKVHKIDGTRSFEAWQGFILHSLFSRSELNIFKIKVNPLMWKFFRAARHIVNREFIVRGVPKENRNIRDILDARMC